MPVRIALVGDYNADAVAHRAIPETLAIAAADASARLEFDSVPSAAPHLPVQGTGLMDAASNSGGIASGV